MPTIKTKPITVDDGSETVALYLTPAEDKVDYTFNTGGGCFVKPTTLKDTDEWLVSTGPGQTPTGYLVKYDRNDWYYQRISGARKDGYYPLESHITFSGTSRKAVLLQVLGW